MVVRIRRLIVRFARASETPTTKIVGTLVQAVDPKGTQSASFSVRGGPSASAPPMARTTSGGAGRGSSSENTAEPITSPPWSSAMMFPAFVR